MNGMKTRGMRFANQLPMSGTDSSDKLNSCTKGGHPPKNSEMFFNLRYVKFDVELGYLADLSFCISNEIKSSPRRVGSKLLDYWTGGIFEEMLPFARNSSVKCARLLVSWARGRESGGYNFISSAEIMEDLSDV